MGEGKEKSDKTMKKEIISKVYNRDCVEAMKELPDNYADLRWLTHRMG